MPTFSPSAWAVLAGTAGTMWLVLLLQKNRQVRNCCAPRDGIGRLT